MIKKLVHTGAFILMTITILAVTGCSGTESPVLSGEKQILSFTVTARGQEVSGDIDEPNHRITLVLPAGAAVTALKQVITLSAKAAVVPASGAAQNFTQAVTYTVTAEDGTTQDYRVTVIVLLPLDKTVAAAKTAAGGIVVSADGTNVEKGQAWVTPEAKAALDAALKEAEQMLADPEATEE